MEADLGYDFKDYGVLLKKAFAAAYDNELPKDFELCYEYELDSTNEEVKRRADKGAKEGLVVVASTQNSGQGRSGRKFYSPDCSGLYMTMLLRPKDEEIFKYITVMAAVSAAEAVNDLMPMKKGAGIKWVNDIYIDSKKVGGIIARAQNYGRDDMYVILGIGINVFGIKDVPDEIKDVYASIFPCDYCFHEDRKEKSQACPGEEFYRQLNDVMPKGICASLAAGIYLRFFDFYLGHRCDYKDRYRELSCVIGKNVYYEAGDDIRELFVEDIDEEGSLVAKDGDGVVRRFRDGEIRIKL